MNKEELYELLKYTYKKTLQDNSDDFLIVCNMLNRLCVSLMANGILTKDEVNVIFDINEEDLKRGENGRKTTNNDKSENA